MKRRKFIETSFAGIAGAGFGLHTPVRAEQVSKERLRMPAVNIPVAGNSDVLVCGGGPAGFAAAVSAARNGAAVQLIELQGQLGGIWTAGLMTHFIDAHNKGGIMQEVLGVQKYAEVINSRWFDVEVTKLWLEKLCMEAGVKLLYHTRVVDAIVERGRLTTVITENSNGRQAWNADIFLDTTGNGDLAARAGCRFDMGHPESGLVQPLSLNMLITGVRLEDLQEHKFIGMPGMPYRNPKERLLAEIRRAGADCSYSAPSIFPIRDDFFSMMTNHQYKVNPLDTGENLGGRRSNFLSVNQPNGELHDVREQTIVRDASSLWPANGTACRRCAYGKYRSWPCGRGGQNAPGSDARKNRRQIDYVYVGYGPLRAVRALGCDNVLGQAWSAFQLGSPGFRPTSCVS